MPPSQATAADKFPKEATVYVYKGQILEQAERFPEAEKAYKKAFKMDKTNSMPLFHLGVMALRGGTIFSSVFMCFCLSFSIITFRFSVQTRWWN